MDQEEYLGLKLIVEEAQKDEFELNGELNQIAVDLKSARAKKTRIAEKIDEFRQARKTDADSLYTKIDGVLSKYKIIRAAYHGGDLTGGCVKNLMKFSTEIFTEIGVILVDEARQNTSCKLSQQYIETLCTDIDKLLTRWDGALHMLHTKDPAETDCLKAQEYIDKALEFTRKMGISVTVKGHGGESHIVDQMRKAPGGLFDFDESWTEQYHQTGHQLSRCAAPN